MEQVDTIVIGAGVVGLACARALAMQGREVLIIEAENAIGTGISSRNSEVIHAGIYYPKGSLKARACVEGNRLLQEYAQDRNIPYRMTGKLIVAATAEEEKILGAIKEKAIANGVRDIDCMSGAEALALEPHLNCRSALHSLSTGIIDTHALMLALLADAEAHGATLALNCKVSGGRKVDGGIELSFDRESAYNLRAKNIVIAAGLSALTLSEAFGLKNIPQGKFCKGNYFSVNGKSPFSRLIYPVPVAGGLGTHYTLDLGGRGRFGPDVEWVETEDYHVNESRKEAFVESIKRYWPLCSIDRLEPAYAGIRPKIVSDGEQDFKIMGTDEHGAEGVIALLGIESPGLTSSLAIADVVSKKLG